MNRITQIFKAFSAATKAPTTELVYQTPFELLIAVMLSAQATDKSVNLATQSLFIAAPTPEAMLALGEEKLKEYVKTINLYPTKSRHIIATCKLLITQYAGEVPTTREALESLPGVGRKTANVLLNTLFGIPTIAVDTHVFRVATRLALSTGKTPLAVEQDLMKVVPKAYQQNAHHWLILHGRYTCTARAPKCTACLVKKWCPTTLKSPERNE